MGYLGDMLGTRPATIVTNLLVVAGALASALLSWGDPQAVWGVIAVSRFFLGVGVGGLYPLSAARAATQAASADPEEAGKKAADAFFWQGPGACTPYLFAFILLLLPRHHGVTSLQFRGLLLAGAIPASIVLLAVSMETADQSSTICGEAAEQAKHKGERTEALSD